MNSEIRRSRRRGSVNFTPRASSHRAPAPINRGLPQLQIRFRQVNSQRLHGGIDFTHHYQRRPVADVLRGEVATDAPERIVALIAGRSASPLQGLISGSFDLDKIDYLQRDARMCGVTYGEVDEDRLLQSMVILADPATGRASVGILEKGLSAVETLLFAKYQMYRNVYWHHACRSATAMYKRIVERAVERGAVGTSGLGSFTDEGLLHAVESGGGNDPMLAALRERRLYKRAFEAPAAALPASGRRSSARRPPQGLSASCRLPWVRMPSAAASASSSSRARTKRRPTAWPCTSPTTRASIPTPSPTSSRNSSRCRPRRARRGTCSSGRTRRRSTASTP